MAHYLVTGCAGFIASRVVQFLLNRGDRVTGLDNFGQEYDHRLKQWRLDQFSCGDEFKYHHADVRDVSSLSSVFGMGLDAVLSFAAKAGVRQSIEDPLAYAETNYIGTLNLLELCNEHNVDKFVLASTSSVYGDDTPPPFNEGSCANKPLSPYASSKKAAETLAYTYHHIYGIDTTVLRLFTVYGPAGRPDMAVFKFIRSIAEGLPIPLYGNGGKRDFTHVDDVTKGVAAALKPIGYEIVNLGGDRPAAMTLVVSIIESALGKKAVIDRQPRPVTDPDTTWANVSKAARIFDWRPQISLQEGLQGAVEWYLENREWAKEIVA